MKMRNLAAACAMLFCTAIANADTYFETFDQPFPAWESGWFGLNTDAGNFYCSGARGCSSNSSPGALWIVSATGGSAVPVDIHFNPSFGASIQSLRLELRPYIAVTMNIYNSAGVVFQSTALSSQNLFTFFDVLAPSGVSRVLFSGNAAGNLQLGSIQAITAAVPEPSSAVLLLIGAFEVTRRLRSRRSC